MAKFLVLDDYTDQAVGLIKAGTVLDNTKSTIPAKASTVPYIAAIHDPVIAAFAAAQRILGVGRISTVAGFLLAIAGVAKILETGGPTVLSVGAIANGQVLTRSGAEIVGVTPGGLAVVVAGADYVPALTDGANVSASALVSARYQRVGSVVFVEVEVSVTPTAGAATATELGIALPVASALAAAGDLSGQATQAVDGVIGTVIADAVNDRASLNFGASDTAPEVWRATFAYRVI